MFTKPQILAAVKGISTEVYREPDTPVNELFARVLNFDRTYQMSDAGSVQRNGEQREATLLADIEAMRASLTPEQYRLATTYGRGTLAVPTELEQAELMRLSNGVQTWLRSPLERILLLEVQPSELEKLAFITEGLKTVRGMVTRPMRLTNTIIWTPHAPPHSVLRSYQPGDSNQLRFTPYSIPDAGLDVLSALTDDEMAKALARWLVVFSGSTYQVLEDSRYVSEAPREYRIGNATYWMLSIFDRYVCVPAVVWTWHQKLEQQYQAARELILGHDQGSQAEARRVAKFADVIMNAAKLASWAGTNATESP